jgi:hypothetical protein
MKRNKKEKRREKGQRCVGREGGRILITRTTDDEVSRDTVGQRPEKVQEKQTLPEPPKKAPHRTI